MQFDAGTLSVSFQNAAVQKPEKTRQPSQQLGFLFFGSPLTSPWGLLTSTLTWPEEFVAGHRMAALPQYSWRPHPPLSLGSRRLLGVFRPRSTLWMSLPLNQDLRQTSTHRTSPCLCWCWYHLQFTLEGGSDGGQKPPDMRGMVVKDRSHARDRDKGIS